jgi:hypothetical protein
MAANKEMKPPPLPPPLLEPAAPTTPADKDADDEDEEAEGAVAAVGEEEEVEVGCRYGAAARPMSESAMLAPRGDMGLGTLVDEDEAAGSGDSIAAAAVADEEEEDDDDDAVIGGDAVPFVRRSAAAPCFILKRTSDSVNSFELQVGERSKRLPKLLAEKDAD